MMKTKLTVLASALLFALSGAAIAQQSSPTAQPTTTPTTGTQSGTQDTTATESSTHGSTVSGVARGQQGQDAMSPPETPPGALVSEVAQGQGDWMQLDADGDGILSDTEIQADTELAAAVATYDTDADGQLSRVEFDSYVRANADGSLTADVDADADLETGDEEFE